MGLLDALVLIAALAASYLCLSIAVGVVAGYLRERRAHVRAPDGEPGIFVKHGMVIDPETGEVTPQATPSRAAKR